MSVNYYGKSIVTLMGGEAYISLPDWWCNVRDEGTKVVDVRVKDGAVQANNGTSTTHYKTFSAMPKWMQDKVLKLSVMPEMHMPIVGLGRRCRSGLYQVLVPEHILSRGGPKPRTKWRTK